MPRGVDEVAPVAHINEEVEAIIRNMGLDTITCCSRKQVNLQGNTILLPLIDVFGRYERQEDLGVLFNFFL